MVTIRWLETVSAWGPYLSNKYKKLRTAQLSMHTPWRHIQQRRMVVCYRRFGENYLFHLQNSSSPRKTALPLKMGLIGCPKTPVINYHFALPKVPKEGRSHLHDGTCILFLIKVGSKFGALTKVVSFRSAWKNAFVFNLHSFSSYKYRAVTLLQGRNFSTSSPLALPGRNSLFLEWCETVFLTVVWMCVWILVSHIKGRGWFDVWENIEECNIFTKKKKEQNDCENYLTTNFTSLHLIKCYSSDKIVG
jgi:hypothetical protein